MQGSPLDLREQPGLAVLARLVATMRRAWPDAGPLLVGAMARDVLLSFAHGIRVARATTDMDFAFGLDGWNSFAGLRNALLADGSFAEVPGVLHRLVFEQCHRVDLLPFGGVERADRSIAWPSPHVVEMTMLGYREAAAQAVAVRLPDDVVVALASLPAQAVLKLRAITTMPVPAHGCWATTPESCCTRWRTPVSQSHWTRCWICWRRRSTRMAGCC